MYQDKSLPRNLCFLWLIVISWGVSSAVGQLCASSPCFFNGSCTETGNNNYSCQCLSGFTGLHCEFNISTCQPNPCQRNGTCTLHGNMANCTCISGWTGSYCNIDVDECLVSPCGYLGTCHNTPGGYNCTCMSGFTGKHCDKHIDECKDSPCLNQGVCEDLVDGYRCICTASFTGKNCEVPLNDCSAQPCKNGGTCHLGGNGFTCSCKPGFTGLTCDINIDECSSLPCQFGGTCIDGENGFVCQCGDGFRGRICQVLFSVSFQRGSYLPAYSSSLTLSDQLSFQFRTTLPAGLLLYQGADLSKEHTDHLIIELTNGSVRLSLNTGVNTATATVGQGLNDGVWHKVNLHMSGSQARISVDEDTCVGQGCTKTVVTTSDIGSQFSGLPYLGSVPLFLLEQQQY